MREALPAVGPGCVGAAGRKTGWFLLSEKKNERGGKASGVAELLIKPRSQGVRRKKLSK